MSTKQELATLRELTQIYRNCPDRVAVYIRWRWVSSGIAWLLIFVAFVLSSFESVSPRFCIVIALLGGVAGGLSFLFSASAQQVPILVRYSTLRDDEVHRRLQELGDAQPAGRDEPPPR